MTHHIFEAGVLIPKDDIDRVLALLAGLDHKEKVGQPTGTSVAGPITHYGYNTRATGAFAALVTGHVTPQVEGFTEAEIQSLVSRMLVLVLPRKSQRAPGDDMRAPLAMLCEQHSLHRMEGPAL